MLVLFWEKKHTWKPLKQYSSSYMWRWDKECMNLVVHDEASAFCICYSDQKWISFGTCFVVRKCSWSQFVDLIWIVSLDWISFAVNWEHDDQLRYRMTVNIYQLILKFSLMYIKKSFWFKFAGQTCLHSLWWLFLMIFKKISSNLFSWGYLHGWDVYNDY